MAQSVAKKLIRIDVSIDTVCPWCFVGKKNLEKAIASTNDQYDFEVRWHPFFLNPSAPKEGVSKSEYYIKKFGATQWDRMAAHMAQIFRGVGYDYDITGLTGNTLDSHRLINYAGTLSVDKQNAIVEELFLNYMVQGKYIGDKGVLAEAAAKVGIEGAVELLEDPNKCLKEVYEDLEKYSSRISGVPNYLINGKIKLNGSQQPETFLGAFKAAAN